MDSLLLREELMEMEVPSDREKVMETRGVKFSEMVVVISVNPSGWMVMACVSFLLYPVLMEGGVIYLLTKAGSISLVFKVNEREGYPLDMLLWITLE